MQYHVNFLMFKITFNIFWPNYSPATFINADTKTMDISLMRHFLGTEARREQLICQSHTVLDGIFCHLWPLRVLRFI